MWIFTRQGLLSIVECRDDKDMLTCDLVVRSRQRKTLSTIFPGFQNEIIENRKADYRFRLILQKEIVKQAIGNTIDDINYDNFKSSIADDDYHDALLNIWIIFRRFAMETK